MSANNDPFKIGSGQKHILDVVCLLPVARGLRAAVRQASGPNAEARQAKVPSTADRFHSSVGRVY